MLLKIIQIIFVLNISALLCDATKRRTEFYEANAFPSPLDDLKTEPYRKIVSHSHPRSCAEATAHSLNSGIYEIQIPNHIQHPFKVLCDATTQGGNWTVILKRTDGSVDFYRKWNTYKKGFGDLDGEFFLGLDKIHALTAEFSQELIVILEDFEGNKAYETFEKFAIGDEDEEYAIHTLGEAHGTAGDSLSDNFRQKFTTFDRDHDTWSKGNCAESQKAAWWYHSCSKSHLTGKYNGLNFSGIYYEKFNGFESLKRATMMLRPRTTF
ncbi:ficolin-1-like [Drosophila albomicans]|uniref:Ficolin-1-like n=1 Tax=Drosophila albomicans TaxID=7291 RepID=A0A9C6W404_DROAB|nr:ficolin-1-like [Drosophila albomicans]